MSKKILHLVMGPQASGKSTFVQKFLNKHPNYRYICSDLYWPRDGSGGRYWTDDQGNVYNWGEVPIDNDLLQRAYSWAFKEFRTVVELQHNILYEGTLVDRHARKRILTAAKEAGYNNIIGTFFYPSLYDCAKRNVERRDRVPDVVLARTYASIAVPQIEEGFTSIEVI